MMNKTYRYSLLVALTIAGIYASTNVDAAERADRAYPSRPVRIVTTEVAGGADFTARLIAQGLTASLGQQVVVDNRASGVIPGSIVARATPDGYTLLLYNGSLWIAPFIQQTPYDPVRDFAPITLPITSPNLLIVHPSVAARSTAELIALAKSHPGELNYGSSSNATASHLSAELFKAMAGVNLVRITYKGAGPALNDLVAGQVQVMFVAPGATNPHIKAGRLRALAVTSSTPSALFPGLPTVGSTIPGYESISMTGIFAPASTPSAVITRLNKDIVHYLEQPEVKARFFNAGQEVTATSAQGLADAIRDDRTRMGKVIKDAGIRAE